jgi:atypical dual specificity phosphatase
MIGPGSGDALLAEGVEGLVSLTLRDPGGQGHVPESMRHLHLPVPDMTAPPPDLVDRAMAFIQELIDDGRAVAVHCGAGIGRTGTILACYLVHLGLDAGEAIRRVRERRPGSIETRDQEETVRRYAARRAEEGAA